KLDQDTLDKLVENTISQRRDRLQEPRFVSQALSSYALRGKDSPYLLAPSNRQLRSAKLSKLAKVLAALPNTRHRTTYFGPRDGAAVTKIVAIGKRHRKVRPRKPVVYRKTRGTEIFFVPKDVAQSQIILMLPKPPIPFEERPKAELYNGYVGGGMGGLIFQELREARGLAYSAFAGHRAGRRPKDQSGVFGYIGTQSDKTIDALTTMLDLLRHLPMQPDRLAKAKQAIDRRYRASRVDPRAVANWVLAWDDLGRDKDPRPFYWETIGKLDQAALESFAAQFSSGPAIISLMGDESRIDMAALGKIGTIRRVKPEQLVSW
ncbi:MAG: insulinase family protein, partial [Deltaproteobacteria bacterium]